MLQLLKKAHIQKITEIFVLFSATFTKINRKELWIKMTKAHKNTKIKTEAKNTTKNYKNCANSKLTEMS